MSKRRLVGPVAAIATAAALAMPVAPAQAAETCHPPRYDTVRCACIAVGTVWIKVTGGEWQCA